MIPNPFESGQLAKVIVQAYQDNSDANVLPQLSDVDDDTFQAQVNPESITMGFRVVYEGKEPLQNSKVEQKFAGTKANQLTIDFLFDDTGVIPATAGPLDNIPIVGAVAGLFGDDETNVDLSARLNKLIAIVYKYDGTQHRPRKVQLRYGKMIMDAVLTSMNVEYKLFKSDGTPIRAIAKAVFEESVSNLLRSVTEKKSSPDLTHMRSTIAGDKLPLVANGIYRSPKYYLEVARINKLFNFRNLKDGTAITFPPLEKTTK